MDKIEICNEILVSARSELFFSLRFLDIALSAFRFGPSGKTMSLGTDGEIIYYNPEHILHTYQTRAPLINRAYLHMVFHCLYRHVWKEIPQQMSHFKQKTTESSSLDQALFDLACDIAVEHLIDSLDLRSISIPFNGLRRQTYEMCYEKLQVLTAEGIFHVLKEADLTERLRTAMALEFFQDDHGFWTRENQSPQGKRGSQKWEQNSDKTQTGMETMARHASEQFGSMLQVLKVENEPRYHYKDFLKKFTVMREEMGIDDDSFDPIAYTYGLEHYGNVPLIEPLETKEAKKIEEFAVIIDTSLSTKEELVERYLQETYGILESSESFFRKINLHIIQSDLEVQSDVKVTCREEWEEYMNHFTLKGGGGTDFRPAISYVEEMVAKGEFEQLKGVLYFTDGYGEFPKKRPPFEAAFVFLEEKEGEVAVPPWAMKLVLPKL